MKSIQLISIFVALASAEAYDHGEPSRILKKDKSKSGKAGKGNKNSKSSKKGQTPAPTPREPLTPEEEFQAIDTNMDGVISFEELIVPLSLYGKGQPFFYWMEPRSASKELTREFLNPRETLNFTAFLESEYFELLTEFKNADADNDGFVTFAELVAFAEANPAPCPSVDTEENPDAEPCPPLQAARELLDIYDIDFDDRGSFKEKMWTDKNSFRIERKDFEEKDLNGDGFITYEEAMIHCGDECSNSNLASRLTWELNYINADFNQDGVLSYFEYFLEPGYFTDDEVRAGFFKIFEDADLNADGFLSEDELRTQLTFESKDPNLAPGYISQFDADGDGQLNFEEFLEYYYGSRDLYYRMRYEFATFDADEDGSLTLSELTDPFIEEFPPPGDLPPEIIELINEQFRQRALVDIIEGDLNANVKIEFNERQLSGSEEFNDRYKKDIYETIDEDEDNYMTAAELKAWQIGLGLNPTDEEIEELIAATDIGGDGKLVYGELVVGFDRFEEILNGVP